MRRQIWNARNTMLCDNPQCQQRLYLSLHCRNFSFRECLCMTCISNSTIRLQQPIIPGLPHNKIRPTVLLNHLINVERVWYRGNIPFSSAQPSHYTLFDFLQPSWLKLTHQFDCPRYLLVFSTCNIFQQEPTYAIQ